MHSAASEEEQWTTTPAETQHGIQYAGSEGASLAGRGKGGQRGDYETSRLPKAL